MFSFPFLVLLLSKLLYFDLESHMVDRMNLFQFLLSDMKVIFTTHSFSHSVSHLHTLAPFDSFPSSETSLTRPFRQLPVAQAPASSRVTLFPSYINTLSIVHSFPARSLRPDSSLTTLFSFAVAEQARDVLQE